MTTTCPECRGARSHEALVCGRSGGQSFSHARRLDCSFCRGTGVVGERRAAWWETGRRLQQYRVQVLKRSGAEEAARLDLDPVQLNHQEHGRICAACPCRGDCPGCVHTPEEAEATARYQGRLPALEVP